LYFSYEDIQSRRESDREKIIRYTTMIAEAQAEAEMLRARFKSLTNEQNRLNNDNARIYDDLQKARTVRHTQSRQKKCKRTIITSGYIAGFGRRDPWPH
jgi:regulator of replication initiation timing